MFCLFWLGFGYSRTPTDSSRLWIVAFYGTTLRNCPDFHSCRFLLLLCQKVGIRFLLHNIPSLFTCFFDKALDNIYTRVTQPRRRTACPTLTLWSGLSLTTCRISPLHSQIIWNLDLAALSGCIWAMFTVVACERCWRRRTENLWCINFG